MLVAVPIAAQAVQGNRVAMPTVAVLEHTV